MQLKPADVKALQTDPIDAATKTALIRHKKPLLMMDSLHVATLQWTGHDKHAVTAREEMNKKVAVHKEKGGKGTKASIFSLDFIKK